MLDDDYYGALDDDNTADKAFPKLVRILALILDVQELSCEIHDIDLGSSLSLFDAESAIVDALTAYRTYQKKRNAELNKESGNGKQ